MPEVDSTSDSTPDFLIEYSTFKPRTLVPNVTEWAQPPPIPLHLLPDYQEGLEGEERERYLQTLKRFTPWKMKDLTIGSYVKLARKLVVEKKMWKKFKKIM